MHLKYLSKHTAFLMLLMLSFNTGCFPIGWVTPPSKIDVAAGPSVVTQEVRHISGETNSITRASGSFDLAGSVVPLQMVEPLHERFIDVEAGYGMRYTFVTTHLSHGPFLGASVIHPLKNNKPRLGLGVRLQALVGSVNNGYSITGNNASLRLSMDWSAWTKGPFDGCDSSTDAIVCVTGYHIGERGIAPYVEVSRMQNTRVVQWTGVIGVSIRLPASAAGGFMIINPISLL